MIDHTPEPWRADANSGWFPWEDAIGIFSDDETIAWTTSKASAREQDEANARLIAAAPDMLDGHTENARVLRYLVNELQGRIEGGKLAALHGCLDRSDAAIAKATGGQ